MPEIASTRKKERIDTIVALGMALHSAGLPAHRLEAMLGKAAERFELVLHAFCLPTGLLLSFEDEIAPQTHLLRAQSSGVHLERLARLNRVGDDLISGRIFPDEAHARIDDLMKAPPRWGAIPTIAAYVLSAAAFAVFFRGGQTELMVAVAVGLAVGALAVIMRRIRTSSRLFELTAATTAAVIAIAGDSFLGHFQDWVPLASGLIILLPGISLVDAVEELSHGHLASGGARMAGVGVAFLALTYGTVLGESIAGYVPESHSPPAAGSSEPAETAPERSAPDPEESAENESRSADTDEAVAPEEPVAARPLPTWALIPALLAVAAGSMVRFRSRPVDFFTGLVGSTVALLGARLGTAFAGPFGGPFLAAFALGLTANIYARWRRQAPELIAIPGIALLVPGSVGVRSVSALLSEDTAVGIDTAFHMFLIAMALVSGLLFSHSIARDRFHSAALVKGGK